LIVVVLQLFHYLIFGEIGQDFVDFYSIEEVIGCLAEAGLTVYAFTKFGDGRVVADLLVSHIFQGYQSSILSY
jgi:hypothetical protein